MAFESSLYYGKYDSKVELFGKIGIKSMDGRDIGRLLFGRKGNLKKVK